MYLPDHQIIFVHIPKTAGNYIQKHLAPLSADRFVRSRHQDGVDRFDIKGEFTPSKHATVRDYKAAMGEGFHGCRIMTCVRHPVDRALSYYFSPHRRMRRGLLGWKMAPATWDRDAFRDLIAGMPAMHSYFEAYPDIVIRYETLREDAEQVFSTLGITALSDARVNASRVDWRAFRDEAAPIVWAAHRQDFDMFGYDRDD